MSVSIEERVSKLEIGHEMCSDQQVQWYKALDKKVDKRLDKLECKFDKLTASINGNGKPGLKQRITRAETLAIVAVLGVVGIKGVDAILPLLSSFGIAQ